MIRISVVVESPQHSALSELLDYLHPVHLPAGTLVRVPLGRRTVTGVVWQRVAEDVAPRDEQSLKPVQEVLEGLPPLPASWCRLVAFSARYYQRGLGELALAVLPPELRKLDDVSLARRLKRNQRALAKMAPGAAVGKSDEPADVPSGWAPVLSEEQSEVLSRLMPQILGQASAACTLLHGVTGSGKTEVYLHAAQAALQAGRTALVLVPEINLTPQLEARFAQRFPGRRLVSLHSGLTPAQRLQHWLDAHLGQAELVLGTRLAVFCSLPRLGLIVVDEEHDPSYKQQDGARYSARDLAVYRGQLEGVPVLLGSATPSLESWHQAQKARYALSTMAARVGQGVLPKLRLVDMAAQPAPAAGQDAPALSAPLLAAVVQRLERGEQSLLFLNRRGFAPVLQCGSCGWKSACPHCSAWRVFHKLDRTLRCHHCGFADRVPKACPDCGNLDIAPVGRGTERLEEQLAQLLPQARVARIDADSTRLKGSLEQQLSAVHAGEVDVLVGTQMITKGHDFRRVTLVAAINPDSALFTPDFRAPERLFSTLLQAAGRAGRDAQLAERSEMWVQTWSPSHPLFAALKAHDYIAFAASQLAEREMAGLPPYSHLALLRTEAREAEAAERFLQQARVRGLEMAGAESVNLYAPVPPAVARVAGLERRQMLVESASRMALQRFLAEWSYELHALRKELKGIARWAIDVDPLAI